MVQIRTGLLLLRRLASRSAAAANSASSATTSSPEAASKSSSVNKLPVTGHKLAYAEFGDPSAVIRKERFQIDSVPDDHVSFKYEISLCISISYSANFPTNLELIDAYFC